MKRPMVEFCVFYCLGIICRRFLSVWGTIFLCLLMLIFILWFKKKLKLRFIAFGLFLTGFLMTHLLLTSVEKISNHLAYEKSYCRVAGVIEVVETTEIGDMAILNLQSFENKGVDGIYPIKILLYLDEAEEVSPSEAVQLTGKIEAVEKPRNPGAFSKLDYYYGKKIYFIMKPDTVKVLGNQTVPIYSIRSRIQRTLISKIQTIFPQTEAAIVIKMMLGSNESFDNNIKELYQIGGISHLLAISGLHITFLATMLIKSLKKLIRKRQFSIFLSMGFIWSYCFLTGFSSSTLRAVLMMSLVLLSEILGEKADVWTAVFTSILLIALLHPLSLFEIGFQLSYGAFIGIIWLNEKMKFRYNPTENPILELLYCSIAAYLMTLPILINSFHRISPYGVLVNLLVVPCASIILGLSFLGTFLSFLSLFLGRVAVGLTYCLLKGTEGICLIVTNLPYSYIIAGVLPYFLIILYYLGLITFFEYKRHPLIKRLRFMPMLLFVIIGMFIHITKQDTIKLYFLDVGQGDSCLMTYHDGVFLVDGGGIPGEEITRNTGMNVVLPAIQSLGITRIDGIFITHSDFDHIYGIIEIIDLIEVGFVVLPHPYQDPDELTESLIESARKNRIPIIYFEHGSTYEWGDLKIECLAPDGEVSVYKNNNNKSLVLQVSYGSFDALLTGDIEAEQEELILRNGGELSSELIKVPHHGSNTSSTSPFIEEVNPMVAVFSYGEHNFYGHPSEDVVERYHKEAVDCFQTALEGAIIIETRGESFEVSGYQSNRKEEYQCKP